MVDRGGHQNIQAEQDADPAQYGEEPRRNRRVGRHGASMEENQDQELVSSAIPIPPPARTKKPTVVNRGRLGGNCRRPCSRKIAPRTTSQTRSSRVNETIRNPNSAAIMGLTP